MIKGLYYSSSFVWIIIQPWFRLSVRFIWVIGLECALRQYHLYNDWNSFPRIIVFMHGTLWMAFNPIYFRLDTHGRHWTRTRARQFPSCIATLTWATCYLVYSTLSSICISTKISGWHLFESFERRARFRGKRITWSQSQFQKVRSNWNVFALKFWLSHFNDFI